METLLVSASARADSRSVVEEAAGVAALLLLCGSRPPQLSPRMGVTPLMLENAESIRASLVTKKEQMLKKKQMILKPVLWIR
jgi:hypothetical protein